MSERSEAVGVADLVALLERHFPPVWAQEWDRVGLVLGELDVPVHRVLCVVDCVPETVEQAVAIDAQLIVAHHPLLLRGVTSVAPTTYKGRIVHRLIRAGIGLYTAHTNADVANPGVSDALARLLGLDPLSPLCPAAGAAAGQGRGIGRIGRLPAPMTVRELAQRAASALPATAWGVRVAGEPDRRVQTVAVCGGAGDGFLGAAAEAGVDAYLTADLRHHAASEYLAEGGPALLDAAHWATERPWLDALAALLRREAQVQVVVSDLDTDPWTGHVPSAKEPHW